MNATEVGFNGEMLTAQSDPFALYQKLCETVDEIETLKRERDEVREALQEIANASFLDNIRNWARNKAKKVLEETK